MAAAPVKFTVKVVIVGDCGVGKTALVQRFVFNKFDKHDSTIGAAFVTKDLLADGVLIKLEMWDTAGQERYRSLSPLYFRGADACLMVYDVTSGQSFADLEGWFSEFRSMAGAAVPMVVVGNKMDLQTTRQVNARDAEEWSRGADCAHFLASAKDNTGVDEVFAELARRAAQYVSTKADTPAAGPSKGRRDVIRNIDDYDASTQGTGCSC